MTPRPGRSHFSNFGPPAERRPFCKKVFDHGEKAWFSRFGRPRGAVGHFSRFGAHLPPGHFSRFGPKVPHVSVYYPPVGSAQQKLCENFEFIPAGGGGRRLPLPPSPLLLQRPICSRPYLLRRARVGLSCVFRNNKTVQTKKIEHDNIHHKNRVPVAKVTK